MEMLKFCGPISPADLRFRETPSTFKSASYTTLLLGSPTNECAEQIISEIPRGRSVAPLQPSALMSPHEDPYKGNLNRPSAHADIARLCADNLPPPCNSLAES